MGERSFFVDPGVVRGDRAEIRGATAHQIGRVLRLRPGDRIELLDNSGALFVASLTEVGRDTVAAEVLETMRPETEPPVQVEIYQALLKGQKMEWVLQKGTEIGVTRFVPVLSERCVSRPAAAEVAAKLERWRAIVREAAEQSGRVRLPEVGALQGFGEACESAAEAGFAAIAWEEERAEALGLAAREAFAGDYSAQQAAVMIGPEGGFSEREAEAARAAGLQVVGLGPRILRAETAAIVAATVVLWEAGGLGGRRA